MIDPSLFTIIKDFLLKNGINPEDADNRIFWLKLFIYFGSITIMLFIVRLNMSMELFDRQLEYYHEYLEKIHPLFRMTEWFCRLIVFLYILIGTHEGFLWLYNIMVRHVPSKLTPMEPLIPYISATLGLVFLFILLVVWDLVFIIARLFYKFDLWKFCWRFTFSHFSGIFVWSIITYVFCKKEMIIKDPMAFALFAFTLLAFQLGLVIKSLLLAEGTWYNFNGSISQQYLSFLSKKIEFVSGATSCSNCQKR